MPGPLVVPLIAAGANLAGQGINALTQGRMNRKMRQFTEHMYDRQRADALADWQREVDYNDPSAQMLRFAKAGLNPNLVYGDMQNSPSVRSSQVQSWNPQPVSFDLGGAAREGIDAYFANQVKTAQVDNVTAQTANLQEQNNLIKAQTLVALNNAGLIDKKTQGQEIQNTVSSLLMPGQLEAQQLGNMKTAEQIGNIKASTARTVAQTTFTLSENDRRELMKSSNLKLTAEKIALTQAMTALTRAKISLTPYQVEQLKAITKKTLNDSNISQQLYEMRADGYNPTGNILDRGIVSGLKTVKEWSTNVKDIIERFVKKYVPYR